MSYYVNNICFRGGGETTGSVAHNDTVQVPRPANYQMSFKADSFEYSNKPKEKKHTGLKIAAGTLVAAAAVIGGLGCASKYSQKLPEWLSFLKKEGFMQDATKKCHEWCHWTVEKGRAAWDWTKGLFSKKNA